MYVQFFDRFCAGTSPVWSTPQCDPLSSIVLTTNDSNGGGDGGAALCLYTGHADGSVQCWDLRGWGTYTSPRYSTTPMHTAASKGGSAVSAPVVGDTPTGLIWRNSFGGVDVRSLQLLKLSALTHSLYNNYSSKANANSSSRLNSASASDRTAVLAAAFTGQIASLSPASGDVLYDWTDPPSLSTPAGLGSASVGGEKWTCIRPLSSHRANSNLAQNGGAAAFVCASALKSVHMFQETAVPLQ